jgi:hypothetical protein
MTKPTDKSPRYTVDPGELLIQYEFTQMLSEHLKDCWEVFEGDLGEMMVLATLGQAQLGMFLRDKEPVDMDFTLRARAMSASRLSHVTGIPRQTVRRKLKQMEKKGWVYQDEDDCWGLAIADGRARVLVALEELYARGAVRVKRMVKSLKDHVQ